MSFRLYVHQDGHAVHHYDLDSQRAAVTIALALMKQGIKVERIELPDGQKLDAEEIQALGETP